MQGRHLMSIVLFILALVVLVALGFGTGDWLAAALVALAFALVGLFFFRRGK